MADAGYAAANRAAAAYVSGGDAAIEELVATGVGLIHVLQVYTSSMVREFILILQLRLALTPLSFS
jgi:hypothetical protein